MVRDPRRCSTRVGAAITPESSSRRSTPANALMVAPATAGVVAPRNHSALSRPSSPSPQPSHVTTAEFDEYVPIALDERQQGLRLGSRHGVGAAHRATEEHHPGHATGMPGCPRQRREAGVVEAQQTDTAVGCHLVEHRVDVPQRILEGEVRDLALRVPGATTVELHDPQPCREAPEDIAHHGQAPLRAEVAEGDRRQPEAYAFHPGTPAGRERHALTMRCRRADSRCQPTKREVPDVNIRRSVLMAVAAVSVVSSTTLGQATHVEGKGVITRSYLFDLDTGAATTSGGDFWYHHDQGVPDELAPFDPMAPHSATMHRIGTLRPTYHQCATAPLSTTPVAFSKLTNGSWNLLPHGPRSRRPHRGAAPARQGRPALPVRVKPDLEEVTPA